MIFNFLCRILVGATRDNFTDKPEIPEPGNVYACPVNFNDDAKCSILPNLRTAGKTYFYIEFKSFVYILKINILHTFKFMERVIENMLDKVFELR